ncbi:SDR family NAD(P)-dependent oxidoreductase, partial [Neisseria dentiae]|uniref:SDR family NAD(P)-dependent oxidoreductase n=1 Tax=Neisseria dentiae TaxID=194197 RepID=UPI00359FDAC0
MKQTALITGASNGIGLELAKIHAKQGGDLVLVARSADKLAQLAEELRSQYGVLVTVIAQDLTAPQAAQAVFAETERLGIQVDILMNNAGIGGHGRFFERELAKEQQMIQLNITTLTELTHLYLQGMVARRRGKILNVSSTASFMPGPLQAV